MGELRIGALMKSQDLSTYIGSQEGQDSLRNSGITSTVGASNILFEVGGYEVTTSL